RLNYIRTIEKAVKRLVDMTDQFYDLARIETNQKEMAVTSVSLPNIVEEIFLSFYDQLEEKGIEIQFPEQTMERKVIADPLMLTRVIQNMVQNILRYAQSKAIIQYQIGEDYVIFTAKNDIPSDS